MVDLRQIPAAVDLIEAEMNEASNRSPSEPDRVEGRAAVILHEVLRLIGWKSVSLQ